MTQAFIIALHHDDGRSDLYLNRRGTWTDDPEEAARLAQDDAKDFAKKTRDEIVKLADAYSGDDGIRAALLTSIDWIDRAIVVNAMLWLERNLTATPSAAPTARDSRADLQPDDGSN